MKCPLTFVPDISTREWRWLHFLCPQEYAFHFLELFLSFFSGFPYEKVRERTLYLQVLDYDRFSRNDPIGEVSIPLNKVELGQIKTFWKELKPCSDGSVRAEPIITRLWGHVLADFWHSGFDVTHARLGFKQSHKLKHTRPPPKRPQRTHPNTSPLRWFGTGFFCFSPTDAANYLRDWPNNNSSRKRAKIKSEFNSEPEFSM